MQASFWTKIKVKKLYNSWTSSTISALKNKPDVKKDEVAVKITIEIPDSYFETPELAAKIVVPADAVNKPIITPTVQHNISEELKKQLGMSVHVTVPDDTPEPVTTKTRKKS